MIESKSNSKKSSLFVEVKVRYPKSKKYIASKVYHYGSIQVKILFFKKISNDFAFKQPLDDIKIKAEIYKCKSFPCAWRIRSADTKLINEQYKDNGYSGSGNRLLGLLRENNIVNALICAFIARNVVLLNTMIDHSPIVSAASVTLCSI